MNEPIVEGTVFVMVGGVVVYVTDFGRFARVPGLPVRSRRSGRNGRRDGTVGVGSPRADSLRS